MKRLFRRFRRDESGSPAIEFALVMPFFFAFTFSFYDIGAVMLRQVTLNSSVDIVARELRVVGALAPSANSPGTTDVQQIFRERVCERAFLLNDCQNTLVVDMRPIPEGTPFPTTNAPCINRGPGGSSRPATTYNQNANDMLMYVRVCAPSRQMMPGFGVAKGMRDENGDIMIFSTTAFLWEV